MEIKQGDFVTLRCGKNMTTGFVTLCSPCRLSLGIQLDDVLKTTNGVYARFIALMTRDDGHYHDLIDNDIVEVTVRSQGSHGDH